MKKNKIAFELLNWYNKNKRDLPWRQYQDPYKIWLSEVILQQTRVEQGTPYFLDFVSKYPMVYDLAKAPVDDVLRTWQGLGYYSRARNLHKCAQIVVDKYKGIFPSERNELMKLPGIGPYTSAAIASLAFGKKEAVVDGNVIRVITRLFGIEADISERKTLKLVTSIADDLIPNSNPDLFNQAIMEFGALHCTPNSPQCATCIFLGICESQKNEIQDKIPFKSRKTKKRVRYFNYLCIQFQGKYLMRKREKKDIWNGLFEFFLLETESGLDFDQLPFPKDQNLMISKGNVHQESGMYKHLLSHQTIMCKFYEIEMPKKLEFNPMNWDDFQLYSKEEIEELPKSILINRYLEEK